MPNDLFGPAYARPGSPTRAPRGVEYDIFARTTAALRRGWDQRRIDHPAFVRALADNQRLWTVLAADVAEPGNGLPQPLKARLFYLYEFTMAQTRAILDGRATVEVLVDVNTAVMRGLRGDGGAA